MPAIAHAGADEKGLRAGVTLFVPEQNDTSPTAMFPGVHSNGGVSFGSFVTFRGSPNVAFQLEGTVSDKLLSTERCSPSCVPVASLSLWYFEAPLLLRIDLLPANTKFHFDLGPELVLSLGGTSKDAMTGSETQLDLTPGNFGAVVGAGLEFGAGPGRITVDARYKRWAAPLTSGADENGHLKSSHQFVIEAGYAFP